MFVFQGRFDKDSIGFEHGLQSSSSREGKLLADSGVFDVFISSALWQTGPVLS